MARVGSICTILDAPASRMFPWGHVAFRGKSCLSEMVMFKRYVVFKRYVILNLGGAEMKDRTTAESITAADEIVLAASVESVFSTV